MKQSKLFGKTVRDLPKDMSPASHKLLYKGGFIRESRAGRYYFLPLGRKVQLKIIELMRKEMNLSGAQELLSPVLHPIELWEETNRTDAAGFELMRVKDRRNTEFALGGTAEEMMVDLVRQFQISYKDMPFNIYQFSTKFRDELRARGGLLRVREFTMKDAYSFHTDEENFKLEYQLMWDTYLRIFSKLGLKASPVLADNGYIGGEYCHEFVVEADTGESAYFTTKDENYCVHEDLASFIKDDKNSSDKELPLEEVEAKRGTTVKDGVDLHNKPVWQQIKNVLYKDNNNRYILVCLRADYDVNEIKLRTILNNKFKDSIIYNLESANDEEIRNDLNSEPGFISPVNIMKNINKDINLIIVGDNSLRTIKNAYSGNNALHKDLFNINIDRDYTPDIEGDIALAKNGFLSLDKKQKLIEKKGIEVGNIFQLGYHYSEKMKNSTFKDKDGKDKPYYMGCYGIGIGRAMATVVEVHHDENGIIWPEAIAPYKIHLVSLGNSQKVLKASDNIYEMLLKKNIEVLFDDRDESPGVKLKDSDLIGLPYRIIISEKNLENNKAEIKRRSEKKCEYIDIEKVIDYFN